MYDGSPDSRRSGHAESAVTGDPEEPEEIGLESLADDPVFDLPEFGRATRSNIRSAEQALAIGETHFKAMPEPGSAADRIQIVDAGAFLDTAVRLRDTARNCMNESEIVARARAARTSRALHTEHLMRTAHETERPAVRSARRETAGESQKTGPMAPLEEGVTVRPNDSFADAAAA